MLKHINAVELISTFESPSLTEHVKDVEGDWVIGYRHKDNKLKKLVPMSQEAANVLLEDDLLKIKKLLNKDISKVKQEHQIDALAALYFDIGADAFNASNLKKYLSADKLADAIKEWSRLIYFKGRDFKALSFRRRKEIELFKGLI